MTGPEPDSSDSLLGAPAEDASQGTAASGAAAPEGDPQHDDEEREFADDDDADDADADDLSEEDLNDDDLGTEDVDEEIAAALAESDPDPEEPDQGEAPQDEPQPAPTESAAVVLSETEDDAGPEEGEALPRLTSSGDWARPAPPPEGLGVLTAWFKRQPIFALTLIAVVLGSPFGVSKIYQAQQRADLEAALARWEAALSPVGLPVPYLDASAPATPVGTPQDETRYLRSGLRSRLRALKAWSALLAGDPLPEASEHPGPLESALLVCRELRKAQTAPATSALDVAHDLISSAKTELQPTLELAHQLLAGDAGRVAARAASILQSNTCPPSCRPALEALRTEANKRRLRGLLAQRPPTRKAVEELGEWVGKGLREALVQSGGKLAELLAPGVGDLRRGLALLELFGREGLTPSDFEDWELLRAALGTILEKHIRDPNPGSEVWLRRLLVAATLFDSASDHPPVAAFLHWQSQLQVVVDRPQALLALTLRFLEAGRLPVGVTELIGSHYLNRGEPIPVHSADKTRSSGQLLLACLLESLEEPLVLDEVRGLHARLEARLKQRPDALARRQRAIANFALAKALHRAGQPAAEALQAAEALGFSPLPVLLALKQAVSPKLALEAATERVKLLEAHAAKVAGGDPDRDPYPELDPLQRVAWEIQGFPADRRVIVPWRAAASFDLGELALTANPKLAKSSLERALRLSSHDARGLYLYARVLLAEGDKSKARKACFQGMRAAGPEQQELRRKLRALLIQLGPG